MINDQIISTDYYTAAKGSTIIMLNTSYLETLSLGKHKLSINYQDGTAETTFTIQAASVNPSEPSKPENPQNGNDSNPQDSTNTQNETSQNKNDSSVQPTDTPQTGDNSFIGFLIGLIVLAITWTTTNIFIRRKRSSK